MFVCLCLDGNQEILLYHVINKTSEFGKRNESGKATIGGRKVDVHTFPESL